MDLDLSRRGLFAGASLTAVTALAGMAQMASAQTGPGPGAAAVLLEDPAKRARVRARMLGSCGEETVNIFYRLHIYGFTGDGSLIPFFTMNHLSVNQWKPAGNDKYSCKTFESGAYCKFDSDEPLEEWVNPITGEKRKVWQFLGGPFQVTIGADGIVTEGADITPKPLRMDSYAGMVFLSTAASMARPNPISPEKYPTLSSGKTAYWETQSSHISSAAQAFDESVTRADTVCQFQNLGSWHPWLGMGQRPGRTYGKALGAKIKSLEEIPAGARRSLEKCTPEIFDIASWTKPRLDILEYVASQTPSKG
jgi:hypothetical protein